MSAPTGEDPMLGDEILDLRCELGGDLIVHAEDGKRESRRAI